ncbi:MAG: ABC-F family ATP-binding cassette domain-containing protein [Bacteroidota bacterium]
MLLALEQVTCRIGGRVLFENAHALVNNGERIGLVGNNGTGKSTLLKMIAGERPVDEGSINEAGSTSIGYLPQDGVAPQTDRTVFEEVYHSFEDLTHKEETLQQLHEELGQAEVGTATHDKLLKQTGQLQEELEKMDAYSLPSRIRQTLSGLGFSEEDMERPTHEFSGGWLMRIALAKLLIERPSVLLLDEPTNHLDIDSLDWLEQFLRNYPGAIIMVSHDRAFLNTICNRTWALEHQKLKDYPGNYAYYQKKREEEKELRQKAYENQQREIKQIQEFIDRFRYKASKAKQVQSRIKQLEKMEKIELESESDSIHFDFPSAGRSGAITLKLEDCVKHYDDTEVFNGVSTTIERGERIAVVGPNGAGKSTLIRMMAGEEPLTDGVREVGHNVDISYFGQHQAEELNLEDNIFDSVRSVAKTMTDTQVRTLLGCFMFNGDEVFKKIKVLSGGEKSRVALARMLVQPANLLVMDEPTNHLDMPSKNVLQQALDRFDGSFIIVSHDRDFMDPIVNKTLEVREGQLTKVYGDISYYLDKRHQEQELQQKSDETTSTDVRSNGSGTNKLSRKEQRRIEAEQRQEKYRRTKPFRKKIDPIEQQIEELEARKEEIESIMAQPDFYDDGERVQKISKEYDAIQQQLDDIMEEWEGLALQIAEIEAEYD